MNSMVHFLPSGHEVLEVNNLAENLHLGLLVNLLLAHRTSDLAGSLFNTADNSMGELVLIGSSLVDLDEDSLLTSVLAIKNDNNLSGLKTLDHPKIKMATSKSTLLNCHLSRNLCRYTPMKNHQKRTSGEHRKNRPKFWQILIGGSGVSFLNLPYFSRFVQRNRM